MRFEESLIKICIEKLEASAKRVNELRRMHVDENYEGDIKPLVAKEIREKIEEYYRVWNILRDYFEENPLSHSPDLDAISSILWLKDVDEKHEPTDDYGLTMQGVALYGESLETTQRLEEDENRLDLFKALKDIDIIDELNSVESSLISFNEEPSSPPLITETTLTESDPIKSFQDFYLMILDERELKEGKLPHELPASPTRENQSTTSKKVLEHINLMKQYRDYVDRLRPDLCARVRADYDEYQEASEIVPAFDEASYFDEPQVTPEMVLPVGDEDEDTGPKEFNHKLKYYTIEQDPDSSEVNNHTPKLAVYHINGASEAEGLDVQHAVEGVSPIEGVETSVPQETGNGLVFSNVITDVSMIFGVILFIVGAYFTVTNLFSSSGIESAETIIQILYLLIDQLPGVPISVNFLRSFYVVYVGIVFLAMGMMMLIMSVGLIWKIEAARYVGLFLYLFSSIFDVIDILYFGSVGSPLNLLSFIINLVICGVFVKDTVLVNYRLLGLMDKL